MIEHEYNLTRYRTAKRKQNMKFTPDYKVQIFTFDESVKPVRLITLAAWAIGIETLPQILPIVREFLGAPKSYPKSLIVEHIKTSYDDVKEQLGL